MTKSIHPSRRAIVAGLTAGGALLAARPSLAQMPPMPPLSVWGKLPAVQDVALSPDGKRVAMVMDKGGERAIVDYELATGKASAAIIDGDKLRDLMWVDNEYIVLETSKTMKDVGTQWEQWFGLMMNLPTGKRRIMYDGIAGVNTTVISGNINRIKTGEGYRVTASSWKTPEGVNMTSAGGGGDTYSESYTECLYYFNPATGRGFKMDEDARNIDNWVVKPDGRIAARSEYNDKQGHTFTIRMKTDKGWNEVYSVKAEMDRPTLLGLGRDGESVLVGVSGGDKADTYFELDTTGKMTTLEATGVGHYPIFHPATRVLAGFGNSGPIETYTFYDPTMQRLPILINKALPDSINDLISIAENPRQVVVRSEKTPAPISFSTSPPALSRRSDLPTPACRRNGSRRNPISRTTPPMGWKSARGLRFRPRRMRRTWPWSSCRTAVPNLSTIPASTGCRRPLLPGATPFCSRTSAVPPDMEKGYGEFGRKMQTDLSDGVAHLVKQGLVNPKRVAIAGASYGGYAALAGVTLQKDIYNCAVSVAGLSDLKSFNAYISEWSNFDGNSYSMRYWRRFTGGDERLDEISPVKHVDTMTAPVLLIHGKDDIVVPYRQTELMYNAMTRAGKPVELAVMTGEDHWLSREPSRVQTLEAMVAFLLKHNPPT
jgi:dienelactone hydrolase